MLASYDHGHAFSLDATLDMRVKLASFWGDAAFRLAVYESRAPDKAPHRWRENEYLLRVALRHRR